MRDLDQRKDAEDTRLKRKLDSSEVDTDMSPSSIQKRLETLGQLSRLASYLSKGVIVGKAEERPLEY